MIDFHCHVDLYPHPHEIVDEVQSRSVGVLSMTTTPSAWVGTSQLARNRVGIRTALGLHPHLAYERKHELKIFDRYLADTRFVGEVGLDGSPEFRAFWAEQVDVFDHILHACSEAGDKIISIHSRRAATPVLDVLDRFQRIQFPILHWFSGSRIELKRAIERGCWFSVGPAMLASNTGRTLVAAMPRNQVLLETDGPFAQLRRVALQPWDVALACRSLSELWDTDYAETERIILDNEKGLLGGEDARARSTVPR